MIELQIDQNRLDEVVEALGATEAEVKSALRRTISRMCTWLKTRAARSLSKELQLKTAVVRKRLKNVRFRAGDAGGAGGVWIGLNPIDLLYVGGAAQDERGVALPARGKHYKGAFMGPRPGTIATRLRGRTFARRGEARFPIDKVGMDIQGDAERALDSDVMEFGAFADQFYAVFERELRWRMNK